MFSFLPPIIKWFSVKIWYHILCKKSICIYLGIFKKRTVVVSCKFLNKKIGTSLTCSDMEVPPGFEPGNKGFADLGLTTWQWHRAYMSRQRRLFYKRRFKSAFWILWSGRRGSNSLPPPWQGGALPDELRPHMVPPGGIEPPTQGFSVPCSTDWATEARRKVSVATRKRLELSTSCVTGRRSNQLNYRAGYGGNNRARTYDPLLVRQMLSQLSYAPIFCHSPQRLV